MHTFVRIFEVRFRCLVTIDGSDSPMQFNQIRLKRAQPNLQDCTEFNIQCASLNNTGAANHRFWFESPGACLNRKCVALLSRSLCTGR